MTETMSIRNKSTDRIAVKGWTGNLGDLAKVIKHCRALEASAQNEVTSVFKSSESARKSEYLRARSYSDPESLERQWPLQNESELAKATTALTLKMSATQKKWDREMSGNPDDVMKELDADDIVKITLSIGSLFWPSETTGYAAEITFDRTSGVEVRSVAPNSLWVESVTATLRSQLVNQRPWYWWLRYPLVPYLAVILPIIVASPSIARAIMIDDPASRLAFALMLGSVAVVLGLVCGQLVKKLIPAFELVADGRKAFGARALGVVGASLLWILGTLVVPILLSK